MQVADQGDLGSVVQHDVELSQQGNQSRRLPAFLGLALLSYGVFALSRTPCLAGCVNPEREEPRQGARPAPADRHHATAD
ncbi:hypothetical protein [Streptomyces sp. NPDC093261]|uniref:hypothetical protein n=1 Tax=Streptomyces sp. NPDC093261 TaxID=3366037 RepID=UPI00382DD385